MDDKKKNAAPAEDDGPATEREETDLTDTGEQEGEETSLILKFNKPYVFEGQEYTELDLSAMENTTAATLSHVGRAVNKQVKGLNPATLEMTMEYAQYMAQRVTGKPLEFFSRMPVKEAIKLKGIVVGFLFGGDGDN